MSGLGNFRFGLGFMECQVQGLGRRVSGLEDCEDYEGTCYVEDDTDFVRALQT